MAFTNQPPGAAFPGYQALKDEADALRAMSDEPQLWGKRPRVELSLPSRHTDSVIPAHIYLPDGVTEQDFRAGKAPPQACLLNWHGSGFVYPNLGQNALFCDRTAKRLGIYVIDSDYSKSPEYPFPRALHDGVDAAKWVIEQTFFDASKGLAMSGWSAGGNLTLALSTPTLSGKYGLSPENAKLVKAGISIFPVTDCLNESIPGKLANGKDTLPPGVPGITFTEERLKFFFDTYSLGAPANTVLLPEVSPLKAPDTDLKIWLEKPLTIVTCEHDPLEAEAVAFTHRLQGQPNADVELLQLKGVAHSWEFRCPHEDWGNGVGGIAKRQAYDLIEKRLKDALHL